MFCFTLSVISFFFEINFFDFLASIAEFIFDAKGVSTEPKRDILEVFATEKSTLLESHYLKLLPSPIELRF